MSLPKTWLFPALDRCATIKLNTLQMKSKLPAMIQNKKIVVVMPAYNAELTLETTYNEIPFDIIDEVILTDDYSNDDTIKEAKRLGIEHVIAHESNKGYGGNQKTCYDRALGLGADIIIMLHPDYQYTPKLIHSMAYLIANNLYPVVLGSRILGKGALIGGMQKIKAPLHRIRDPRTTG